MSPGTRGAEMRATTSDRGVFAAAASSSPTIASPVAVVQGSAQGGPAPGNASFQISPCVATSPIPPTTIPDGYELEGHQRFGSMERELDDLRRGGVGGAALEPLDQRPPRRVWIAVLAETSLGQHPIAPVHHPHPEQRSIRGRQVADRRRGRPATE